MAHPIDGLMNSALKNIKEMVDVNTIVGEPILAGDGIIIIPVSKVSFGLAVGGSNFGAPAENVENQSFGGGSGAGVTIAPIAFLVVSKDSVKMLPVSGQGSSVIDKIIDMAPEVIDNILNKFKKEEKIEYTTETVEDDFVIG